MLISLQGDSHSATSSVRRKLKGGNHGSLSGIGLSDQFNNGKQSLAFELAAAMDPTENDQSSILDQLGLGDDDEEGGLGYAQDEDEEEVDHGEQTLREGQHDAEADLEMVESRQSGSPGWREHGEIDSSSPSKSLSQDLGELTPTRPSRRVSRSTMNTGGYSPHRSYSFDMVDEFAEEDEERAEDDLFEGEEEEDYYEQEDDSEEDEERSRTILEAGLVSTAHFLAILKQSNTDCQPTSTGGADPSSSDRQPAVEKLIVDIVRTMAETSREREAQIRELKEIEVALSHTDRRALAEVDSLPMILEEADFRTYIVGCRAEETDGLHVRNEEHREEASFDGTQLMGEGQSTPLANRATSFHNPRPVSVYAPSVRTGQQTPSNTSGAGSRILSSSGGVDSPMNQLNQLKLVTTSLIGSLNLINEHTQISRQTQTDVVRKLKGVRGLVTNWKTDHESLENSKEYISRWESELGLHHQDPSHPSSQVRGKFEVQIKLVSFIFALRLISLSSYPLKTHPFRKRCGYAFSFGGLAKVIFWYYLCFGRTVGNN